MPKDGSEHIFQVLGRFELTGSVVSCTPYGNGHINDTFLVVCTAPGGGTIRYILQSVNHEVFHYPEQVMDNIERVTGFLRPRVGDSRGVMRLVPAKDGRHYWFDGDRFWRIYDFIEHSVCLERPESIDDFYECAVAFGRFQRDLSDFPAGDLHETIPDFHNTPKRFRDFLAAVKEDRCGRAAGAAPEIEGFSRRAEFYSTLYDAHASGVLPLRVTHNDTKINNVMLDAATRKALCVIDLDTVMPGFSVNDFGDSIRFGPTPRRRMRPTSVRSRSTFGCSASMRRDILTAAAEAYAGKRSCSCPRARR